MNIIEVIPITKGIAKETLSYFTSEQVRPGSVVHVPLRKKTVPGIVIGIRSVAELKGEIKNLPFEIKKVSSLNAAEFFLPEFIEACADTARYFASSTGSVLNALTPAPLFEEVEKITLNHGNERKSPLSEKYVVQADDEERFAHYKSLIREEFARKSSVFFCLPTIHDIETTLAKLVKGIEDYTYVLSSSLSKKEFVETYNKMLNDSHPVLIIATGSFLSVPRKDIGAIIVDREHSKAYKTPIRPYLDIRTFAEYYSKKIKAKLIFGDLFLQTETMFRYHNAEFQELYPLKFRSLTTAKEEIVDMRTYKSNEKNFTVISDQLAELVGENKEANESMFIFTARKGLSPSTVCGDCGNIVKCTQCESAMVLHKSPRGNFFLCHKCGERRDAQEKCRNCDSWKLVTLGIGIERVEEEIKKRFPDINIFILDKDYANTHKKAQKIASDFYASPGSVLIGTEMALLYLDRPIQTSAIASLDALFSVPDFKISEKILGIILKMRAATQRKILLQTRNPEQPVFTHAMKGNIVDFYRDEIELRRMFDYPPFSILIKLSLEGKRDEIATQMAETQAQFEEYGMDIFPSFVKGHRGNSILNALIKTPRKGWPNEQLIEKLRSLPPQYTIKVDPETLL